MRITHHGRARVFERTNLQEKDVRRIIENEAYVWLGKIDAWEYLLFYSPNDRYCKIAVVNKEQGIIQSIWKDDYFLPEGITRVTKSLRLKARKKLVQMLVVPSVPRDLVCITRIRIIHNGRGEYSHDAGLTPAGAMQTTESAYAAVKESLKAIFTVVENAAIAGKSEVRYEIRFFHKDTKRFLRSFTFLHTTLRQRFAAA